MSAFMISAECMNNIINGIYFYRNDSSLYCAMREKNLKDGDIEESFLSLANDLFYLNQSALLQRYPNEKPNSEYIQIPKFKWNRKLINKYQFLMSLRCLIYQCSEGDIDKEPLYKWLNDLKFSVMDMIIQSIPEYNKAKWD